MYTRQNYHRDLPHKTKVTYTPSYIYPYLLESRVGKSNGQQSAVPMNLFLHTQNNIINTILWIQKLWSRSNKSLSGEVSFAPAVNIFTVTTSTVFDLHIPEPHRRNFCPKHASYAVRELAKPRSNLCPTNTFTIITPLTDKYRWHRLPRISEGSVPTLFMIPLHYTAIGMWTTPHAWNDLNACTG